MIYLDYAANTPVDKRVLDKFNEVTMEFYGNPNSLHNEGIKAKNLIELACSLGFPTIFLEILSLNKIYGLKKMIYLLIYIFFYIIDDIIILILSIKAFEAKGISTKFNKYVNLIGGILLLIMGILLIFKPEWIMFSF